MLNEAKALARLERNGVKVEGHVIILGLGNHGLKVWTAIDCLVHYYKHSIRRA